MAADIPPSSPHLHRHPRYHLHSMHHILTSHQLVYHHSLRHSVDTLSMPTNPPPNSHTVTLSPNVNIITSTVKPPYRTSNGLSAAKPPWWWRSDVGTTTTAAPCGVGLWRRNPLGVLRCAQPLDATAVAAAEPAVATTATTTAPSILATDSQECVPCEGILRHIVLSIGSVSTPGICLLAWMGWNADIEGRGLGELCTYDKMFSFKET
ncbi:hypothetical protein Tco_0103318 [Tanacetum coccineum]